MERTLEKKTVFMKKGLDLEQKNCHPDVGLRVKRVKLSPK